MSDTSARPTLRDIEASCEDETGQHVAISLFLERLDACGYVITHPDDVPSAGNPDDVGVPAAGYRSGWNDCRNYVMRTGKYTDA